MQKSCNVSCFSIFIFLASINFTVAFGSYLDCLIEQKKSKSEPTKPISCIQLLLLVKSKAIGSAKQPVVPPTLQPSTIQEEKKHTDSYYLYYYPLLSSSNDNKKKN